MPRLALFFVIFTGLLLTSCAVPPAPHPLTAKIANIIRTRHPAFAGTVHVRFKGRTVYAQALGLADRERALPVTRRTPIHVASVSKTLTAVTVLSLVDKGRLSVDDTLDRFFPDCPEDKKAITVAQLLSHRAGVDREKPRGVNPLHHADFMKSFLEVPLVHKTGSKTSYSNMGYHALAAIVEVVTGQTFDEVVKDTIISPLNLNDTGRAEHFDLSARTAARGYGPRGEDIGPFIASWTHWRQKGSAYWLTTADDLVTFAAALEQGKLLKPSTVKRMLTPPDGANYALGWQTARAKDGTLKTASHGGQGVDCQAMLKWFPGKDTAIAVVGNAYKGATNLQRDLTLTVTGKPLPELKRPPRTPPEPGTLAFSDTGTLNQYFHRTFDKSKHPSPVPSSRVNYVDGKREGPFALLKLNGKARISGHYESGRLKGPVREFDSKGRLRAEDTWSDDGHGHYRLFDREGKVILERLYRQGKEVKISP